MSQQNTCTVNLNCPVEVEGFGTCTATTQLDMCEYSETTELEVWLVDGVLTVYEASEPDDEEPSPYPDPEYPKPKDPLYCDPCAPKGKYVGQYKDLFMVGGKSDGFFFVGELEVIVVPEKTKDDDTGKEGKKVILQFDQEDASEPCCCTGSSSESTSLQDFTFPSIFITLAELRMNVDNTGGQAECNRCQCDAGVTASCAVGGTFNDACPGLGSVISAMIKVEANNCSEY